MLHNTVNLVFITYLLETIFGNPLIFEESPTHCIHGNTNFRSKLEMASNKDSKAFFNICDYIPEHICGKNVKACIKNINSESALIVASEFYQDKENEALLTKSISPFCKNKRLTPNVTLKFFCYDRVKEPQIIQNNDCDYEIHLLSPECVIPCTTRIHGQLKDLYDLKQNYIVQSKHKNFSLSICKANPVCSVGNNEGETISACDITNNTPMIISTHASEKISFINDRDIKIHGYYKSPNVKYILEIIVKCDFSKSVPEIYYKEQPNPGKIYHFEMLTSQGCIKIQRSCEFEHNNLIYNLNPLANQEYLITNLSSQRQLLLNLCRPLIFSTNEKNHCSETLAQVCEKNGHAFTNYGSLQTAFEVNGDTITTTFSNGDTCQENSSKKYETTIEFICGAENKMQFNTSEQCKTLLKWSTPSACPKFSKQPNCVIPSITHNCTFNINDSFYDLNSLATNNKVHIVKDPDNSSIEYVINICKPVMEDPCKRDVMVVLRHVGELDVRKKELSLGKFKTAYKKNNVLVLEATSGAMCVSQDYKSIIYLECANKDGPPKLRSKTKCTFEFVWETNAACPIAVKSAKSKQCTYKHPIDKSNIIDLHQLVHATLNLKVKGTNYTINICGQETKCDNANDCIYVPEVNYYISDNNKAYLESAVNKSCKNSEDFNKILIELVCDPIVNHEHYKIKNPNNCILPIELWTNLVCSKEELILQIDNTLPEKTSTVPNFNDPKIAKNPPYIYQHKYTNLNCTVTNPNTNYQFNIAKLNIKIPLLRCPSYRFDYSTNSIELTYSSIQDCQSTTGQFSNITSVIMFCVNETSQNNPKIIQQTPCQFEYQFKSLEFCSLLGRTTTSTTKSFPSGSEESKTGGNSGTIIGTTVTILVVIIIVGLVVWRFHKKKKCNRSSYENLLLKIQ